MIGIAEMFAELDGRERQYDALLAFASRRAAAGRSYYERNRERVIERAKSAYRAKRGGMPTRPRLTEAERAARARASSKTYYERNRERVIAKVSARYHARKESK